MKPEEFGALLADQVKVMQGQVAEAIKLLQPALAEARREMELAVQDMVKAALKDALEAMPAPAGLADAMTDGEGNLVLVMSDGRTKTLGRVIAKDGKPGEPGLAFDDFSVVLDDARPVLKFAGGGREARIPVPGLVYRGVWEPGGGVEDGGAYGVGDAVTLGGNVWIAKAVSAARPGQDDAWQLAVRAGRDLRNKGARNA